MMVEALLQPKTFVLIALAYLMVTAVLTTLAYQRRNAVSLHDRVRESKIMRKKYFDKFKKARDEAGATSNVIIEDDDDDDEEEDLPPQARAA